MDEWTIPLMLTVLFPSTLLYVSLYSFIVTGSAIIGGPFSGYFVDNVPRLIGIRILIVSQKVVIGISAALLYTMDRWLHSEDTLTWKYVVFAAVIFAGCILKLSNMGSMIAIEKDWVVVIAAGNSSNLTS
jgi:iron-regulated transporter 1